MNLNLKIEGVSVDLAQGSSITLQKNSNIFGTPDKIQTSKSYTITLPFTLTNEGVMQHLELPSVATSFLTTAKNATLEADGLPIFKGRAVLLSIEKDGYQIALTFGELTALAALVSDNRKISELGLTEIFGNWFNNTPNPTDAREYALYNYNYGMAFDATRAQLSYSAQVEFILDLITFFYEITFNYTDDISKGYLILTKNLNANEEVNPQISYTTFYTEITSPVISENDLGSHFAIVEGFRGRAGLFCTNTSKIDKINFTINFLATVGYDIYLKRFNSAGVLQQQTLLNQSITNNIQIDAANVTPGDFFQIYGTLNGAHTTCVVELDLLAGESYPLSSTLVYKLQIENYGSVYTDMQFPIVKNLDFTAAQLLKELQLFNGLFSTSGATGTEIDLKPYSALSDRSTAQNMSNMFISLDKSEFTYDSWGKYNQFSYKESDGEITADYNTCLFLLTNYQLKESAGLASVFGTGANESPIRINQYTINESGETLGNNLPIIYAERPASTLLAVPFRDILQNKYEILIKSLQNFRICTINLHFSHLEYNAFEVNEMIYLKQIGKYFYPISADYNPNNKILVVKALLLGSLADDITLSEIPLSQSAQSVASGAASLAQSTFALVVNNYGKKIVQVADNEILTTDWTDDTGTSGFWYADISNANILSTSVVDVIPEKAYKSIVDVAEFASETDSSAGSVRIYATNQPTSTIEVTLNIFN